METLEILTTNDLVESGACRGGVLRFRDKYFPSHTAVSVDLILEKTCDKENILYIKEAACRSGGGGGGYGDGGYGGGDGYGGFGDGYGDGCGCGFGDGGYGG